MFAEKAHKDSDVTKKVQVWTLGMHKNTTRRGKQGESRTWRAVHSVVCWVVKMDALLAAW